MIDSEEDRHLRLAGEADCAPEPLPTLRHSTAHLMAQAVTQLFPGVKVAIGPAIEDGFYYDFSRPVPFTPEDLERIETTMHELTQKDLDQYLWRLEEAKKRDHRKLGRELDLFEFHDVAPGAAFWLPGGMILVRELEKFARERLDARGYQEISTPLLVNKKLWEQSGHWELYSDNMFKLEIENETF